MKTLILSILLYSITIISTTAQTQIGQTINGEAVNDRSGFFVDINSNGDFIAIGAIGNTNTNGEFSGHVRVFENVNDTWTQVGQDIDGEASGDTSGFNVRLNEDGSIVAIAARLNDGVNGQDSGHVRVYENIDNTWIQIGDDVDGEASFDEFGFSIDLSAEGNILAIGGRGNDGANGEGSGHVRVFENINGTWTQVGDDIDGENAGDAFGFSLSMSTDGSIIAVGAVGNDGNGENAGHVRVFENVNGTWTQIGNDIDGENAGDDFGGSLVLNGNGTILAIGTDLNDENGENTGEVRVFENINNSWVQVGQDINGQEDSQGIGFALSMSEDGTIIGIGAIEGAVGPGKALIYRNINNTWIQVGEDINGVAPGDAFGASLSLSADGSIIVVGALLNDDSANDAGQVMVFDLIAVLSVEENFSESNIMIYPNPASHQITLAYNGQKQLQEGMITDINGKIIQQIDLKDFNQVQQIDISLLAKGIYFMRLFSNDSTFVKKLIIQ